MGSIGELELEEECVGASIYKKQVICGSET